MNSSVFDELSCCFLIFVVYVLGYDENEDIPKDKIKSE